jgi:NTE family protein
MKTILLIIYSLLLCTQIGFSQVPSQKRPKVGLVLSGGGAKGLAHIGVLKVLEEAGVKIDYIAGTSMGAVVGGLYASGYNARQIDSIFKATDFDAIVKDFTPRASMNFYEKKNNEMYAVSLPFHKLKIGIPSALSKGMYNYNLLTRLTNNVRHIRDFNKLPIPFLCMATNIETGEEVTLNKGYLPQAILASSALPTLYSPVEIDGKVLVDGGITNNFPVDEIKKLGAEFIIGVDVQDDLKERNKLDDATRVLVQISNLQMINEMSEKIKIVDIYLKPDINGFSMLSFDNQDEIIAKGEEATFAVYEKIKTLVDLSYPYAKNKISVKNDSIYIEKIKINALKDYNEDYVIGKLGFNEKTKISYNDIKIGIDNLNATQNFSAIAYTLEPSNGNDVFNLTLTERPIRTFLKFGLHFDPLYKSGLLVNVTQKKILFMNDIASLDLVLGDNFRYNLDYYIDNGFHWSLGIRSGYNKFNRTLSTDFSRRKLLNVERLNTMNINYEDFSNQLYLQTLFVHKFLIAIGIEHKHLRIETNTIENQELVIENTNYISAFGNLKYDSYDNKHFPKRGWFFSGNFQSFLLPVDSNKEFNPFSIAKGEIGVAKTFFKKATLLVNSEAGFPIGNREMPVFDFVLGGYGYNAINNFKHFYGYDFLSISADSFIKSTFTLDVEIFKKNHVNFAANYANIGNSLFETTNWISLPKYNGYAVGYGLETIVGPIEIKYTWSPELSSGFVWFNAGFWF